MSRCRIWRYCWLCAATQAAFRRVGIPAIYTSETAMFQVLIRRQRSDDSCCNSWRRTPAPAREATLTLSLPERGI
jgi:hypothetical protein